MVIPGIHHVTAIAGGAQSNLDFYAGVLGLRLVKQTVNFDDPATYHLYYGDAAGNPGTLLTFFPFGSEGVLRGRRGPGQATAATFGVAPDSLSAWRHHLEARGVAVNHFERFGERGIGFEDPDGLALELIGSAAYDAQLGAFHSVTLSVTNQKATAALLTRQLGYTQNGVHGKRTRFEVASGAVAGIVDVLEQPDVRRGSVAAGSVHHVAFRTVSAVEQLEWRRVLTAAGRDVTEVMEREYFESIYFREPGGVLFEIATDPPGFTIDEPLEALGQALKLPPWLEPRRAEIEARLPKLRIPEPERISHAV